MMRFFTGELNPTSVEEYYYELDARIQACIKTSGALAVYCALFPTSKRTTVARKGIRKYQQLKNTWIEEQLRAEEWLMDHEAKGWVSS